jgi:universal stress protein A
VYKHILLATELINISHAIEEQAVLMQNLTGAKLSIIYVIEPVPSAYAVTEVAIANDYWKNRKLLEKKVLKLIEPLEERLNISDTRVIISNGRVSDEILRYANNENVDLIIIGSHGCHGIKLLLGSTANAVLHEASCDVLAVRVKEENDKSEHDSNPDKIQSKKTIEINDKSS